MKSKIKLGIVGLAFGAVFQVVIAYASQPGITLTSEQYAKLVAIAESPSQSEDEAKLKAQVSAVLESSTTDVVNGGRESPGP